ncbi:MAG TPA: hypothetical protein VMX17_04590 [Candidatus Glassbacteria bacterium]|nr:hypothetical protein [Candidatus Glassbacteria bacterium]
MNSKEILQSAIVLRVMALCGVLPEHKPSINSPQFKIKDNIYGYKIGIDEESYLGFLYSKREECKFLSLKMFFPADETVWGWYFAVCGDEEGESFDSNKLFGEIDKSALAIQDEKIKDGFDIIELSPSRATKLITGLEGLWEYMPTFSKFEPKEKDLKKFLMFIESIGLEDYEEE